MMARRLAMAVLVAALMLLGTAGLAWAKGWMAWSFAWPAGLIACHAAVLCFELTLQRWTSRRLHGDAGPALAGIPLLVLREMVTGLRVFGWSQPFRSRAVADSLPCRGEGAGVVLLHGMFCNRGVWNRWMRTLADERVPFIAVDLEPPFASIDAYLPIIESAVRRMHEATGRPVVIACHSMGGIAARAWFARQGDESRVHRIFTVASPHHGTLLGRFSRATNARQMGLGSAWLDALAEREEDPARRRRFTCFYSDGDNVVLPWRSARLPGADNRCIAGHPHLALLDAPEILMAVLGSAQQASEPSPGPA